MSTRPVVAFDVDGTLISFIEGQDDKPRWDVIDLLRQMSQFCDVIVWSGGGSDYARHWVTKLNIDEFVSAWYDKASYVRNVQAGTTPKPDIAVDDEGGEDLGDVVILV